MTIERLKKIIGRMFADELSAKERISLAEEQPLASLLKEQWSNGKEWHKLEKVDSQDIWRKIANKCWQERKSYAIGRKQLFLRTVGWTIVSAVAVIAIWLVALNPSYITITAPLEAKKMVVLPDSSKVWLNASASIKYRKEFTEDRKVELEGEGFFDVMKMSGKPFIVCAGKARVEVKGTEFNVKNLSTVTTVTLFTGKVEFSAPTLKDDILMKPNEQISYDTRTGEIRFEKVDAAEYDWRTDRYRFVDKPLKELIDFINRNYKVNITLGSAVNQGILFTGTIRKEEHLMDVLDKICISMDLKMENEDDQNIKLY